MIRLSIIAMFCLMLHACGEGTAKEPNPTVVQVKEVARPAPVPGLVHSVFFWLKEDLSDEKEAAFLQGLISLKQISSVQSMTYGPPAPTEERGVVDRSYSYALAINFEDVAAQDAYQVDPIHTKFVEDHKDKWTKVIVYDHMVMK